MTAIEMLLPMAPPLAVEGLIGKLESLRCAERCAPFDAPLMKLCGDFSQRLLVDKDVRHFPELQMLGYWLRPASLEAMKKEFVTQTGTLTVPQGLVFHLPPANVETMFAYSLFLSLLCGNANVVRLSSRHGAVTAILLRLLGEALALGPEKHRASLLILGYGHDENITEAISRACDVRVIWGGDAAVRAIRAIPLAPFGREIVFPDRFSWSAIDVQAYRTLHADARQKLAERYFNDLFWFGQQGCASPRIMLWRGEADRELTDDFYRRVAQLAVEKNWSLDIGGNLAKQTRNFSAMIDVPITEKRDFGAALTVFSLAGLNTLKVIRKNPCFGGTLMELAVNELSDIADFVDRHDQTLAQFGITRRDVENFVRKLNGKGFDRVVPIGDALAFDRIWDGHDLLANFTRLVTIKA